MANIIYEGVDITGSVILKHCEHDMYAGERADSLYMIADDTAHLWDKWAPVAGDLIQVVSGAARTGAMYVTECSPRNGSYAIRAASTPPSLHVPRTKAWAEVRLSQIGAEIAARHGLAFTSYDVPDRLYGYRMQDHISDITFFNRMAVLEGCAVVVFDGTLILYGEAEREAAGTVEMVNLADALAYTYRDMRGRLYSSCTIECGTHKGTYTVSGGSGMALQPPAWVQAQSTEECARYARNLLRRANKMARRGTVWTNALPGYAAASMIDIRTPAAPSWDGPVFLHAVRNDYYADKTKLFFRKPLEGY